jgi:hypothetical protein
MSARRVIHALTACAGAFFVLLITAQTVAAIDPGLDLRVDTWSSDSGHAYVGVTASGSWAPPAGTRTAVRTEFFSEWQNQGNPSAFCHAWWVLVHRTADGSVVNFDSPVSLVRCGPQPVIGVSPSGFGDLSLYLAVSVDPVTAPAGSNRTVTAELTAGWRNWIDDAISSYVVPDSVRVTRWTVDFGDGTVRTFPTDGSVPDRLTTTHAYGTGQFDVVATAHVTGQAYGAFFTPRSRSSTCRPSSRSARARRGRCLTARSSLPTRAATRRCGGPGVSAVPCTSARSSSARGSCALAESRSAAPRRGFSATAMRRR